MFINVLIHRNLKTAHSIIAVLHTPEKTECREHRMHRKIPLIWRPRSVHTHHLCVPSGPLPATVAHRPQSREGLARSTPTHTVIMILRKAASRAGYSSSCRYARCTRPGWTEKKEKNCKLQTKVTENIIPIGKSFLQEQMYQILIKTRVRLF